MWCRLLGRSQVSCQQTQPAHSVCTETTRQGSDKETGCLQDETRQQEASLHQWYLQPIRCNGTLFRWYRRELESLKTGLTRMTKKSRDSLKRNTENTSHTLVIPAQYPIRRHIQVYTRQSRLGSEICKTPGYAVMLMKSSLLLGRSLQEFYLTDWMNTMNSQGLSHKASVDSERTEEQLTWSAQQGSFQRNARYRTWTSTWPLLTLPKHLTQSVVRVFGKLWRFGCPTKFIAMVRQFHDGMLAQVQNDGEFSDPFPVTKQARLCTSPNSVQHGVLCHAHRCLPGWWQWYTY